MLVTVNSADHTDREIRKKLPLITHQIFFFTPLAPYFVPLFSTPHLFLSKIYAIFYSKKKNVVSKRFFRKVLALFLKSLQTVKYCILQSFFRKKLLKRGKEGKETDNLKNIAFCKKKVLFLFEKI
jgi:hypothetical protein